MPSTADISPVREVAIKIRYQESDFVDTRYANKEVEIKGSRASYKTVTDAEGMAVFHDLQPGVYNLSVSTILPEEDYGNMVNPPVEDNDVMVASQCGRNF